MWLLFLVSWIHCDGFDCVKVKGCCINKTTVSSCEEPGWCCSAVLVRGNNKLGDTALNHYIGSDGTNRYWYCDRSSFLGVRTPQLTPQITRTFESTPQLTPQITPARTYVKCSAQCTPRTTTTLKVQVVYAILQ